LSQISVLLSSRLFQQKKRQEEILPLRDLMKIIIPWASSAAAGPGR
jgi:hypothetical protein